VKDATEIIMWLFVGSLVVLVVTHASGFAKAVTAVGGQINTSATILTGADITKTQTTNVG